MPTRIQSTNKVTEYKLVDKFPLSYRSREDVTNLPPGVMIKGSQNMSTNVSERIQIRKGYALDGATSAVLAPILASFDWQTRGNAEVHLRAGNLTSAGNDGKLQYRYVDSVGAVTWRDLLTGLSSVSYNFTQFWKTSESLRVALFVNGSSQIQEWNGAVTELLSATANTITKSGDTWLDSGFYTAANKQVVINGTTYTYTGGETTNTLTGVSPSPAAEPVGSVIHQAVVTTLNSAMTGITSTFKNGLIRVMNNQIFLGSLTSSVMLLSRVNSYTDYSSSATRQQGEGGSLILDQNLVAFVVQGTDTSPAMYAVAGKDLWYRITFDLYTSVVGPSGQTIGAIPIKSGKRQAAQSQAMLSNMKNNVIAVSNEPTIDQLGVVEGFLTQVHTVNISDSIKLDVDSYDFTDGSIFYFRYNIYVCVPKEGLVLVFNLNTNSWESPHTLPISRFYIVDGELYGHSYNTSESYQMDTGYADRVYPGFTGFPIDAKARFSYQNFGSRATLKSATAFYVEGYINANTTLNTTLTRELDGCTTTVNLSLSGDNNQFVCISSPVGSLGKESLGKSKLGGAGTSSLTGLPPKFRWVPTFSNVDFFEVSPMFECLGVNQRFELLAYGLNAQPSSQEPTSKKD